FQPTSREKGATLGLGPPKTSTRLVFLRLTNPDGRAYIVCTHPYRLLKNHKAGKRAAEIWPRQGKVPRVRMMLWSHKRGQRSQQATTLCLFPLHPPKESN